MEVTENHLLPNYAVERDLADAFKNIFIRLEEKLDPNSREAMFFRFHEFSESKLLEIHYRKNASVTLKSELKSKPIKERAVFLNNCECKVQPFDREIRRCISHSECLLKHC